MSKRSHTQPDESELGEADLNEFMTPPHLFAWLDEKFGFTLDAAANDTNHLCPNYLTKTDDGAASSWVKADGTPHTVWCNPPYGRGLQEAFFERAYFEAKYHGVTSVLLVPADTGTERWHRYAVHAREIWLLRPRIQFINPLTGQPSGAGQFPSALLVFMSGIAGEAGPEFKFVTLPPKVAAEQPQLVGAQ